MSPTKVLDCETETTSTNFGGSYGQCQRIKGRNSNLHGFEEVEMVKPRQALDQAGDRTSIVSCK